MPLWLFKNEPDCFAYADLERDGGAVWDGVTNALAQKHLRSVQKDDRVFYYHTGNEKAIVGVMQAVADPQPDPEDESGKRVAVAVRPLALLSKPVTLAAIKADPLFADWESGAQRPAFGNAGE